MFQSNSFRGSRRKGHVAAKVCSGAKFSPKKCGKVPRLFSQVLPNVLAHCSFRFDTLSSRDRVVVALRALAFEIYLQIATCIEVAIRGLLAANRMGETWFGQEEN